MILYDWYYVIIHDLDSNDTVELVLCNIQTPNMKDLFQIWYTFVSIYRWGISSSNLLQHQVQLPGITLIYIFRVWGMLIVSLC